DRDQGSGVGDQGPGVRYPSRFHIGFIQPTRERVNEINARLASDGYRVPPASIQHGPWTFYFTAPGGFTIEVMGERRSPSALPLCDRPPSPRPRPARGRARPPRE